MHTVPASHNSFARRSALIAPKPLTSFPSSSQIQQRLMKQVIRPGMHDDLSYRPNASDTPTKREHGYDANASPQSYSMRLLDLHSIHLN